MRIVILEPDGTGGMIHFAFMLADALARSGQHVTLVTASDYELRELPHHFRVLPELSLWPRMEVRESGAGPAIAWIGDRVYRGLIRRVWRATRLFLEMWRVVDSVSTARPDVVLVRSFPLPGHGVLLRRLRKSRATIVEVCHEFERRDTIRPVIARLEEAMSGAGSRWIDARVFLSPSVRDRYAELYPNYPTARMFVVPLGDGGLFRMLADPGLNLRSRYEIHPSDRVALFFGNLRPTKGVEDLLHAFARADRPPGSKLLIAGHPARDIDTDALLGLAAGLGIDDSVIWDLTYIPNRAVGPLLELSRFVALPYRTATQSGPLHVAMTYGKPVIATRIGGIPDVVAEGSTGLLVDPGDIDALADAMARLLSDDDLIATMTAATEALLSRHRWSEVAGGILGAVDSVSSEPSLRR